MTPKPLTVRELHAAYIATLTAHDLTGADQFIIDGTSRDDAQIRSTCPHDPLRMLIEPPQDLEPIIYDAPDTTTPTIGDDAA